MVNALSVFVLLSSTPLISAFTKYGVFNNEVVCICVPTLPEYELP